jgi:hypothetical protein
MHAVSQRKRSKPRHTVCKAQFTAFGAPTLRCHLLGTILVDMLRALAFALAAASAQVAAQPASWVPRIAGANMLYTPDDSSISSNNMPMIGNGMVATQLMSPNIFVASLYNGYLTETPSHRARIPATNAVPAPGTTSDAAMDVEYATFYRRSYVDPSANCTVNSTQTCTNANGRIWIEQRWYSHRMIGSVMVMEVEVLPVDRAASDYPEQKHLSATSSISTVAGQPFAMVQLVNNAGGASSDILFWPVDVPDVPYSIINGSTYLAESNTSGLQGACVLTTNFPSNGMLVVDSPNVTFPFLTVIRTTFETNSSALVTAAQADFATAMQLANNGTLHSTHVLEWLETIWPSGYETDRFDLARVVNSSLYAIISSIRNDRIDGICPGGLMAGYNGHKFWDMETWMFPAAGSALHPDLAASMLQYRFERLAGAYAKAKSYTPPYSGAMFPWESALTGLEVCPSWAATGLREIHINGDIAMAVWMYWRSTQDNGNQWLETVGYPILSGIADFWVSRLLADNPGAVIPTWPSQDPAPNGGSMMLSICNVIPPDEYADHVNNSVYTNVGARMTLAYATEAAILLGRPAAEYAAWQNATTRVVIPFNASWPGITGGLHPEYDGYFNGTIKQADVILLGFPLGLTAFGNNTLEVRANDLSWYSKVTDAGGPAMTWGMFAAGYVSIGDLNSATQYFNRSFANAQPPFAVWTETTTGGTPNFLTGAGGFLQVPVLGYPQLVINDTMLAMNPVLYEHGNQAVLRGLSYLGQRLDIAYTASTISVSLQPTSEPRMLVAPQTHTYAVPNTFHATNNALLPKFPLHIRSQRGQVAIDGYHIRQQALTLTDSNGKTYPLSTSPVVIPVQAITIAAS